MENEVNKYQQIFNEQKFIFAEENKRLMDSHRQKLTDSEKRIWDNLRPSYLPVCDDNEGHPMVKQFLDIIFIDDKDYLLVEYIKDSISLRGLEYFMTNDIIYEISSRFLESLKRMFAIIINHIGGNITLPFHEGTHDIIGVRMFVKEDMSNPRFINCLEK
jgi:hypothetical protein